MTARRLTGLTLPPARTPVLRAEWLHPGLHVTAMGSDQAGKNEIAPAALAMERQATLIDRRLSGDEARLQGTVRIAVTSEFTTDFLLDHLPELHAQYPGLELHMLVSNLLASLSRGEADLAVRFASPDAPALLHRRRRPPQPW